MRPWTAESVGYFMQAVLQGSFIFAKAQQGPEIIRESMEHLRRYLAHSSTAGRNSRQENSAQRPNPLHRLRREQ